MNRRKLCRVEGCQNYTHYSGLCKEHFTRNTWRNHPFHNAWINMKAGCRNPNFPQAKDYSERGITYTPDWERFANFHRDMWESWREGLTLERLDNAEGYSRNNCCWATRKEQAHNTRRSWLTLQQSIEVKKLYVAGGVTHAGLATLFGVPTHVIADTLRRRNAS